MVVKATSEASASGLIREIQIDPREYALVQWRWKVSNILKKGNVHRKDGDDYPARLHITFEYDPDKVGFFEKIKFQVAPPTSIAGCMQNATSTCKRRPSGWSRR